MTENRTPAKRELRIKYLNVDALVPDPTNARRHGRKQIARLAAGIAEFGFVNPVLADEQLNLIAGHARLEAARLAGLATVPVIRLSGLSSASRKALAIADNGHVTLVAG